MNRKGLSAVVASVILIAFVLVLSSIVWVTVQNLVVDKIEDSKKCQNTFDKILFDKKYTCYNETSKQVYFSVKRKDIELDSLLVSIEYSGTSKSYVIPSGTASTVAGLRKAVDDSSDIVLPSINGGTRYYTETSEDIIDPTSIKMAPRIQGELCQMTDVINVIDSCSSLI